MTKARHALRRGYTLVELAMAVSVAAVLMGGLGTAVILAGRAVPDQEDPTRLTAEAYHVAEQIAGELFCAYVFTERSANAVEFYVHDRDGDLNPEVIRYAWSGAPGDPLIRQYNGSTAVEVASDVRDFTVAYHVSTQTETKTDDTTTWTSEEVLAYFDGWTSIIPTLTERAVNSVYWSCECFEVVPPADATELRFTQAAVFVRRGGTDPEHVEVGIYRSKGDGSYEPDPTAIGTPATILGSALLTTTKMLSAPFSDVVVQDLGRTDYCLVLKAPTTAPAYAEYLYAKSAPDDGMAYRWTTDGGTSWDPRANQLNQQDLRFYVYGSFGTTGTQEVTVDRYFVTNATVALQISTDASTRVETSVQVLNAPEVASP
jgi:prepilin-type N-terminal cleavage/methylation domain-containing protein